MTEFLPLGSVVQLKEGTKKVMIAGRLQREHQTQTLYDYAAVLWPEGMIDSNRMYLFNHEDIATLFFIGLQDPEEFNYRFILEEQQMKLKSRSFC